MTDQKPQAFLNRWSSRKQQAKNTPTEVNTETSATTASQELPLTDEIDAVAASPALIGPQVLNELDVADLQTDESTTEQDESSTTEPLLSDDDMPAVDSLAADSDLSGFFNKGVSATLRKAALRHVFQLPKFNVRDGLNDYDGDYTYFEPLGDIVTSDMKWHIARKERARLEAEELAQQELEKQQLERQELEQQELEQQESEQQELEQQESEQQESEQQESEQQELEPQEQEPQEQELNLVEEEPAQHALNTQKHESRNRDTEDIGLERLDVEQEHEIQKQPLAKNLGTFEADVTKNAWNKQVESDHPADNKSIRSVQKKHEAPTTANKEANADTEINT